jgi:hypothetical protein
MKEGRTVRIGDTIENNGDEGRNVRIGIRKSSQDADSNHSSVNLRIGIHQ